MASMLASLQRGLPSRVFPSFPSLTRSFISRAAKRPLPAKRDPATTVQGTSPAPYPLETIQTPEDFLTAIGRQAEAKITASTWGDFWRMDGRTMKAAGVTVRDRRYILWCMEKYRLGSPIREFPHEVPPKKTIRGWGPKVQNGKRIRSRRLKNQK